MSPRVTGVTDYLITLLAYLLAHELLLPLARLAGVLGIHHSGNYERHGFLLGNGTAYCEI